MKKYGSYILHTLSKKFNSTKEVSRAKKKGKVSTKCCSEIFEHNVQKIYFIFRTKSRLKLPDLYVSIHFLEFRIGIISQPSLKYMSLNNSS